MHRPRINRAIRIRAGLLGLVVGIAVGLGAAVLALASGDRVDTRAPVHSASGREWRIVAARSNPAGIRVRYLLFTRSAPLAPGEEAGSAALPCPAKFPHPISGIFNSPSNSHVVMTASSPGLGGARTWSVFVMNENTVAEPATIGMVCVK